LAQPKKEGCTGVEDPQRGTKKGGELFNKRGEEKLERHRGVQVVESTTRKKKRDEIKTPSDFQRGVGKKKAMRSPAAKDRGFCFGGGGGDVDAGGLIWGFVFFGAGRVCGVVVFFLELWGGLWRGVGGGFVV